MVRDFVAKHSVYQKQVYYVYVNFYELLLHCDLSEAEHKLSLNISIMWRCLHP